MGARACEGALVCARGENVDNCAGGKKCNRVVQRKTTKNVDKKEKKGREDRKIKEKRWKSRKSEKKLKKIKKVEKVDAKQLDLNFVS